VVYLFGTEQGGEFIPVFSTIDHLIEADARLTPITAASGHTEWWWEGPRYAIWVENNEGAHSAAKFLGP
jgi:hypothetical protein